MNSIPEGYQQDAQGRLVPKTLIKPVDLARDELVMEMIDRALKLHDQISQFKAAAFGDIEAFVEMSAEAYGVKMGGRKGNLSLLSFDGKYKVVRAIQESIQFDERLQAAKTLIDECLRDWSEGAKPELLALIDDAFRVDQQGDIRTARVLALRRMDIEDERWQRAMQAIGDACQVVGSKAYVRFYERIGDSDQFKPIPLDIAGV